MINKSIMLVDVLTKDMNSNDMRRIMKDSMEHWSHSRIISHKDGKTEISQARGKQQLREAAQEDQEEEHMRARLEVYHTTRITGVNASRKGAVL